MITKEQIKELDDILDKLIVDLTVDDIRRLHKAGMIRVFELRDLHCKDATTYDIVTFYLYYEGTEPNYDTYVFENLGCTYGATDCTCEDDAITQYYKTVIKLGILELVKYNTKVTLYDLLGLIYID